MKLSLTFKTPDVVSEAARDIVDQYPEDDDQDNPYLLEEVKESIEEKLKRWVKYGEYITIDFDLDAGTATVREQR